MVIFINGAFGVGKTTVARHLVSRMPHSGIFDPEKIGFVLQHASAIVGRPVSDFQDMASWRRLVIFGIRAMRNLWSVTIVPMAFSNLKYLGDIREGIGRVEPSVLHFCLVAPFEIVSARLQSRHAYEASSDPSWSLRRAAECCIAHSDAAFAEHIQTADLTPEQVANHILSRVVLYQARRSEA